MADISIKVDVQGFEQLRSFLSERLPNAITDSFQEVLRDTASEMEQTTTGICPVRTGFLRGSIDIRAEEFNINAVAGAEYASFVDEGTRYMDAHNFFREPIEQIADGLQDDLESALQEAIDHING